MLRNLTIDNYALIDRLDIDFDDGLSVITGETGAGKSIILGALSLVLGSRADSKVALDASSKCVVEATFDVEPYRLEALFDELDVDYSASTIVRREILPNGKSRAFVNDTPVGLQQLRTLTSRLIDIHSQHENLMLSNSDFQLDIVDTLADTADDLHKYSDLFNRYRDTRQQLRSLRDESDRFLAEKDYIEHQLFELVAANLVDGEQQSLEEEQNLINHSQEVIETLSSIIASLDGEESGVLSLLKSASTHIGRLEKYINRASEFADRINSSFVELKDIASELSSIIESTEFSEQRKIFVDDRLNLIYSLQQKHRVASVTDLIDIQNDFARRLDLIENFDDRISSLQKQIDELEKQLSAAAEHLSERRRAVGSLIEQKTETMLHELGMPNGRFEVSFSVTHDFTSRGRDKIEFLFSANKNRSPQPVAEIASGGEISRLMLVIKSLVAASQALPTIIFDEIDTGISGEIARKMGEIMQTMSASMQVVAITHLPQIASKGKTHYKVFKDESGETTQTRIACLTADERIVEIAEMIAGKNPSRSALDSARELLEYR
jgi:DNA repair protein RecN